MPLTGSPSHDIPELTEHGKRPRSRKQIIAIALSEQRKRGKRKKREPYRSPGKWKMFNHPWLMKGIAQFDPSKHKRGGTKNPGQFTSGGGGGAKPSGSIDRTNPDLDAAMAEPPAKAKPAPTAPMRGNPDLDALMAEPSWKDAPKRDPHVQAQQVAQQVGKIFAIGKPHKVKDFIAELKNVLAAIPPEAAHAFAEKAGLTPTDTPRQVVEKFYAAFGGKVKVTWPGDKGGQSAPTPVPGKSQSVGGKNTKAPWQMSADEAKQAGVTYFRTGQGSLYAHANGQTIRVKSKHGLHDPKDVGLKRGSEQTHFVSPEDATRIGMWQSMQGGGGGKRVIIHNGHAHLVSKNGKNGEYGRDEKPIKLHDKPGMGLSPFELNDKSSKRGEDIHSSFRGGEVWSGTHPGSPITEVPEHNAAHEEFAKAAKAAGKGGRSTPPTLPSRNGTKRQPPPLPAERQMAARRARAGTHHRGSIVVPRRKCWHPWLKFDYRQLR
jgi:hypothetical protein